jgi:hypothetical protein
MMIHFTPEVSLETVTIKMKQPENNEFWYYYASQAMMRQELGGIDKCELVDVFEQKGTWFATFKNVDIPVSYLQSQCLIVFQLLLQQIWGTNEKIRPVHMEMKTLLPFIRKHNDLEVEPELYDAFQVDIPDYPIENSEDPLLEKWCILTVEDIRIYVKFFESGQIGYSWVMPEGDV